MLPADAARTRRADASGYPLLARYAGRWHPARPGCRLAWRARLGSDAAADTRGACRTAHPRRQYARLGAAVRRIVDRRSHRADLARPRARPCGGESTGRPARSSRGSGAPGRHDHSGCIRRSDSEFLHRPGRSTVQRFLGHTLFVAGRCGRKRRSRARFHDRAGRPPVADSHCQPGAVRANGWTPYAGSANGER